MVFACHYGVLFFVFCCCAVHLFVSFAFIFLFDLVILIHGVSWLEIFIILVFVVHVHFTQ